MKNVGRAAREGRTADKLADEIKAQRQRADQADTRWREANDRQRQSIDRFVRYLTARGLMDDFTQWTAQEASAQEQEGTPSGS